MRRALNRLTSFPYTPDEDGNVPEWGTVLEQPGGVGPANCAGDFGGRWLAVLSKYRMCLKEEMPLLLQAEKNLLPTLNSEDYYGPIESAEEVSEPHAGGMANMIRGLIAYSEATEDALGINLACQLADKYFLPRLSLFVNFKDWLQSSGDIGAVLWANEALACLYLFTGKDRYLEFAEQVSQSWMNWDYQSAHAHAHGALCICRGLVILYLITGDVTYLNVVRDAAEVFAKHQTEYFGVSNWLGEGHYEGRLKELEKTGMYTEGGCGSTDWMALNCWLWRATRDSSYLDRAEMTLYNTLTGHQEKNGGWCCYSFSPYNVISPLIKDVYWCCNQWGALGYATALEFAYTVDHDAVLVNFYLPGEVILQIENGQVVLDIDTDYPNSGEVKIRILKVPKPFGGLYFRVPSWSKKIQILRNPSLLQVSDRNGYLGFRGHFREGEEIILNIDLPLRIVDGRFGYIGNSPLLIKQGEERIYGQVALLKGPILLILDQQYNPSVEITGKEFMLSGEIQKIDLNSLLSKLRVEEIPEWPNLFFNANCISPEIRGIYLSPFANLTSSDDPRASGVFNILSEPLSGSTTDRNANI
jgi:hypothetical protein